MNYFVGIDIGGSYTEIGLIQENGIVVANDKIVTSDYINPNAYVQILAKKINYFQLNFDQKITAIGIGAPNGNYFSGAIESPPNLPWKGTFPIASMLEELTLLPVKLTNDANAAALGELYYGIAAEKNIKDFVMVTLGTGLGSGIVVNGQLIYGHDGFAGELGHIIIEPNGRLCGCGRRGCLERYVSATGLVLSAKAALTTSVGATSSLVDIPIDQLSAYSIFEAAKAGDSLALDLFDKTAQQLALALVNTCTITSPKAFIFFGGLSKAGNLLFAPLKIYFEKNILNLYQSKIDLLPSAVPENQAAILGAAALVIKHYSTS